MGGMEHRQMHGGWGVLGGALRLWGTDKVSVTLKHMHTYHCLDTETWKIW
jgi:hypothetical protein